MSREPQPATGAEHRPGLDGDDFAATESYAGGRQRPIPEESLRRGDALGRYVVLEQVGAGGMGTVYAAYDPELDRRVALKVLLTGGAEDSRGEEQRLRLLREAQALARVVHPNVVAVHDVGSVEGQIFLAMEFVEGSDLSELLAGGAGKTGRDWRRRLQLLLEAGRGLEAVHDAGLAHRDFKPGNIRLGADGRVRVLDFGLAQGTGEPAETAGARWPEAGAEESLLDVALTQPGHVYGTPRYMAPEQHLGKRADARSDQFSFCVATWESLFGHHPFPAATSSEEMLRRMREGPETSQAIADRQLARLRPILAKGLAFSPSERHGSLGELITALETASRGPRTGRLWGAASVALAVASAGLVLYLGRPVPCADAAERLTGVWDGDRKASMAAAFESVSPTGGVGPWRAASAILDAYAESWQGMYTEACEATRVRKVQSPELLDLRMDCLEERRWELRSLVDLFLDPTAEMVATAANAASYLRTLEPCGDAERLLLPVPPPAGDPEAAEALDETRESLAEIRALMAAGLREDALLHTLEAVERAQQSSHAPILAEAQLVLAGLRQQTVDHPAATEAYLKAIEHADEGRHDDVRARALVGLVWNSRRQGEAEDAGLWLRQARSAIRRLDDEPDLLLRWHQAAAQVALLRDAPEEALGHARSAVELSQTVRGPEHLDTAIYLSTLAASYAAGGRYREALEASRRSAAIQRRLLGEEHPDLGHIEHNVAIQELMLGFADSALRRLRRSAELGARRRDDHMISVLSNLAAAAARLGRQEEALASLGRALELTESLHGAENARVADVLNYYGDAWLELGVPERAVPSLERALELLDASPSTQRPRRRLPPLLNLALARARLGRVAPARQILSRAEALLRERDAWSWVVRRIEGTLALEEGRAEEAVTQLEEAVRLLSAEPSASRLDLGAVELDLARALLAAGREGRAAQAAEAARAHFAELGAAGERGIEQVDRWLERQD